MVQNIIHFLVIHIATFNVHLNVYLSNHVQLILYGMHVFTFVIGEQWLLIQLVVTITVQHPMVIVETTMVHHLMTLLAPIMVVVAMEVYSF
jgi:hypothetical protein